MAAGLFFCALAAAAHASAGAVHESAAPPSREPERRTVHETGRGAAMHHEARAESPAPAGPEDYALSVTPDPKARAGGVLVIKLKKIATGSAGDQAIGDVMIWWTTPGGRRSSFPIRPFSDDVWVSRVAVQPEAGENRLDVVILGKSEDGTLAAATELIYALEAPSMRLRFVERKNPGAPEKETAQPLPPPAAAARAKKTAPVSAPTIVLLVTFANVCLLTPGLALARVVKKVSSGKARRGGVFTRRAAAIDPVCGKILAGAGMIDPQSGAPLPWSPPGEAPPAAPRELYESTVLDPAPSGGANNTQDFGAPPPDDAPNRKTDDPPDELVISDRTTIRDAEPIQKFNLNDLSF